MPASSTPPKPASRTSPDRVMAGMRRGSFARKLPLMILELVMILFTIVYIYPVLLLLLTSFKTTREMVFTPLAFPKSFNLANFSNAWESISLGGHFLNSIYVSLLSVVFIILFASMAAFALAKKRVKLHSFLYVYFLAGIMVPIYTVLVPLVQLIKNLGLMDSRTGLATIYIGTHMPFAVFLLTGFMRTVPNELVEAGIIDGCSVYRIFATLIFPLLTPVIATLFILDFLGTWNDFLLPLLTLSNPAVQTITVSMYAFFGEFGSQWEIAFAGYAMALMPTVIMYLLLQRYIISGIMSGAIKG